MSVTLRDSLLRPEWWQRRALSTATPTGSPSYARFSQAAPVMAGLVPAIYVLITARPQDVDARHKAGHDEWRNAAGPTSQISQHLGPDGDHSDKQRQRGQRRRFLNYGFQHGVSPRTEREHSSLFVLKSRASTIRRKHKQNQMIMELSSGEMPDSIAVSPSRRSCPRASSPGDPYGLPDPCCGWR